MVAGEHSLSGNSGDEQFLDVDEITMVLIIFCRSNFFVLIVYVPLVKSINWQMYFIHKAPRLLLPEQWHSSDAPLNSCRTERSCRHSLSSERKFWLHKRQQWMLDFRMGSVRVSTRYPWILILKFSSDLSILSSYLSILIMTGEMIYFCLTYWTMCKSTF